jgi:cytochrome c peroxidase
MAAVQLGATLSAQELRDIVTFLESLTGKLPEDFATAPVLPPGGFLADPGTK